MSFRSYLLVVERRLACPPHMGCRCLSDYGGDTSGPSLEMDSLCDQETERGKE
jgi:hypothetical protein